MDVEVKNISFRGSKGNDIKNVSFNLKSGQSLIISGISGCGKSLLLSLICGLIDADSGSVIFNGLSIDEMTAEENEQFRKQLGVVFQEPALLYNLTIFENLLLPLLQHFPLMSDVERALIVEKASQQFNLQRYLHDRVEELSSGMRALASITRALICEPDILIWDAPLADIDLQWGAQIIEVLKKMKSNGKTMIFFTNKKVLIRELADINLQLVDGELKAIDG
jgi:phospholipid/cholesterol/gamma-HCH transport system ATP-binding protein